MDIAAASKITGRENIHKESMSVCDILDGI